MINVLLVTTWGTACGIAEHSAMLKEHVEKADSEIHIVPSSTALDPNAEFTWAAEPFKGNPYRFEILHLNYQAALHSRWTAGLIDKVRKDGVYEKVIVTYHDTGVPNSQQCLDICSAADAYVVHEPCVDLPLDTGHYWRQGVLSLGRDHWAWGRETYWLKWFEQPIVGTLGFPFPWKNYSLLCRLAAEVGWAVFLIAPGATTEQIKEWQSLNPAVHVESGFVNRIEAVRKLAACDATAFLYNCANTGQSGAICMGIAARKPVIAFSPEICRQFRCYREVVGGIYWADSENNVKSLLRSCPIDRIHPATVFLAERDSWDSLGAKYAGLYRAVLGQ